MLTAKTVKQAVELIKSSEFACLEVMVSAKNGNSLVGVAEFAERQKRKFPFVRIDLKTCVPDYKLGCLEKIEGLPSYYFYEHGNEVMYFSNVDFDFLRRKIRTFVAIDEAKEKEDEYAALMGRGIAKSPILAGIRPIPDDGTLRLCTTSELQSLLQQHKIKSPFTQGNVGGQSKMEMIALLQVQRDKQLPFMNPESVHRKSKKHVIEPPPQKPSLLTKLLAGRYH